MSQEIALPPGFETLETFVTRWAISGAENRARARQHSSAPDRISFFEAAQDLAGPALEYLDGKPLAGLDAAEQRLMNLMLSLVHVSLAVEIQGDDEAQHAADARYITITQAPADVDAQPRQ